MNGFLDGLRAAVQWLYDVTSVPILVYFVVINLSFLLLIITAGFQFRRYLRMRDASVDTLGGELALGVSVVMPAHNEEVGIVTSTTAMLSLRYPRHEVVVVDDGSTDNTFGVLREAFDLVEVPREVPMDIPLRAQVLGVYVPRDGHTRLVVVRKTNSGRSEAINAGVNVAVEPLIAFIDADSILEPDALLRVSKPFTDDPTRMVATGGTIRAVNGSRVVSGRLVKLAMPTQWVARIQVVEYLRAFLVGRTGWSRLGMLILISGAFGMFRRDVVVEAGGLDPDSIGEDFELATSPRAAGSACGRYSAVVGGRARGCWPGGPSTGPVRARPGRRWHRGLWETLWAYRGMLFNRRYGRIGSLALPYYWLFELFAPLLEGFGIVVVVLGLLLGVVNVPYALLFLVLAYGLAILVTLAAMSVEEWAFHRYHRWRDLGMTLAAAVLENIGYRQLTVWWRLGGWWASLRKKEQVWGVMTRAGFDGASD